MGHLTPHEVLINTLCSTVLNLVPTISAPVAPSGELMSKFGYKIRLPEFSEAIEELIRTKGAKVPDLLLANEKRKLFIVVECKSDFSLETPERLSKQLEFYSSLEFQNICKNIVKDSKDFEIWIFIDQKLSPSITSFLKGNGAKLKLSNVVVWTVAYKKVGEEAEIAKVYGKHIDGDLEKYMNDNVLRCSPPQMEILLIDPMLTYPERVFRIGRRILAFIASTYIVEEDRTISIQKFRERYLDAIVTDKELKKCFRYLTALVPQIGQYDSARVEIELPKRPSLDKIKTELEKIQGMTDIQFKTALAHLKTKPHRLLVRKPKPPTGYSLEPWIRNKSTKMHSQLKPSIYYRNDVFDLISDLGSFVQ